MPQSRWMRRCTFSRPIDRPSRGKSSPRRARRAASVSVSDPIPLSSTASLASARQRPWSLRLRPGVAPRLGAYGNRRCERPRRAFRAYRGFSWPARRGAGLQTRLVRRRIVIRVARRVPAGDHTASQWRSARNVARSATLSALGQTPLDTIQEDLDAQVKAAIGIRVDQVLSHRREGRILLGPGAEHALKGSGRLMAVLPSVTVGCPGRRGNGELTRAAVNLQVKVVGRGGKIGGFPARVAASAAKMHAIERELAATA